VKRRRILRPCLRHEVIRRSLSRDNRQDRPNKDLVLKKVGMSFVGHVFGMLPCMVGHIKTALFVALFVSSSGGQLRNMAVDETQVLRAAKTVAVFIKLGPPAAAPYRPDFERARKQISVKLAKQKLQVVVEPVDADIVVVVTEFNEDRGATASATTYGQTTTAIAHDVICLGDEVKVFRGGKAPSDSDIPIWSASEVCGFSWPLNRAMDRLAKAMKK
jgi:hypothetical protein